MMATPFAPSRETVLISLYFLLTLSTWSTTLVGFLRDLSSHGKTLDEESRTSWHRFSLVPKQWFVHFYMLGIISSCIVFSLADNGRTTRWIIISLLWLHVSRRCFECLYVHAWEADSKMHLLAYAIGLLHYAILPLNFVYIPEGNTIVRIVGSVICLYAQYEQDLHHRILARQRRSQSVERYVLPQGRWFAFIGSPQYLTEILIYCGFLCILQTRCAAMLLLWVASNQVLGALRTHTWYLEHFEEYKKERRRAIIPFVF